VRDELPGSGPVVATAKRLEPQMAAVCDRSLDEFAAPAGKREGGHGEGDAADPPVSDPTPATPTMRWSPDGAACADCGVTASRLWRVGDGDGFGFVCADCKEW
jgi:hypothetical protein